MKGGATGAARLGIGGAGIFAALPMPLGSLIELLRPPTLPGPCGIPLTPASCARDFKGAAKAATNAKAKKTDLPHIGHSPAKSNEPAGLAFLVRMQTEKRIVPLLFSAFKADCFEYVWKISGRRILSCSGPGRTSR